MHCYIVLVILVFIEITNVYSFHHDDTHEEAFAMFKKKFNKKYDHADHEAKSFGHFKANRDHIIAHNKKHDSGEVTFRLAINDRMDWSPEQHKKINNHKPPSKEEIKKMPKHHVRGPKHSKGSKHSKRPKRQTYPSGTILGYPPFDWRDKNVVVPVRNQGYCGTCLMFAETDALASAIAIQTNTTPPVTLSVQQTVDCGSANLTIPGAPFPNMFIMSNGAVTEAQYPYTAGSIGSTCVDPYDRDLTHYNGTCKMWNMTRQQPFIDRINRTSWGICAGCNPHDEVAMVDAIIHGGPLVVGVNSRCIYFNFYGSGIVYKSGCTADLDHAVLIVGVGVETVLSISPSFTCQRQEIPYYIIKNSWGTGFGQNGYTKVAVGTNELGIGGGGTYATLRNPPPVPAPSISPFDYYYMISMVRELAIDIITSCWWAPDQLCVGTKAKQSVQTQLWQIKPYPSSPSYYTITNIAKDQCISAPDTYDQAVIVLEACNSSWAPDSALFSLEWNGDPYDLTGWYVLPGNTSARVMPSAPESDAPLTLWSNDKSYRVRWKFVYSGQSALSTCPAGNSDCATGCNDIGACCSSASNCNSNNCEPAAGICLLDCAHDADCTKSSQACNDYTPSFTGATCYTSTGMCVCVA